MTIYSGVKRRPKGTGLRWAVWVDGVRVTAWTADEQLAKRQALALNGVVKVQPAS